MEERTTKERVDMTAKAAGLGDYSPCIQLLSFGDTLSTDDIKLMEVDRDLMEELERERCIMIRGSPSDSAVVCTNDKTYELKLVETSNALLLAPRLLTPQDSGFSVYDEDEIVPVKVSSCFSNYFELKPSQPKLERLKDLLMEYPYHGEEYEQQNIDTIKYSYKALIDQVQASEKELQDALESMEVCIIDGCYRILEPDYKAETVHRILSLLEEEDWDYRVVPVEGCCSKLEALEPRFIVEHCLKNLGNFLINEDGEVVCELSSEKVCKFYAEYLLRHGKKFDYTDFMDNWQQAVPVGMVTSVDYLQGMALVDAKSLPPTVTYFPVSDLPSNPLSRFNQLFRTKEKWTQKEIEPYIQDLQSAKVSSEGLLLKFARVSTNVNGEKIFNSKRPIT